MSATPVLGDEADTAALRDSCLAGLDRKRFAVTFRPGDCIFREGLACPGVLFIDRGMVELSAGPRTRRTVISRCGGEQVPGLPSALDDSPSRVTAIAFTPVEGYMVPRALLHIALQREPRNFLTVSRLLSQGVDAAFSCLKRGRTPRKRVSKQSR